MASDERDTDDEQQETGSPGEHSDDSDGERSNSDDRSAVESWTYMNSGREETGTWRGSSSAGNSDRPAEGAGDHPVESAGERPSTGRRYGSEGRPPNQQIGRRYGSRPPGGTPEGGPSEISGGGPSEVPEQGDRVTPPDRAVPPANREAPPHEREPPARAQDAPGLREPPTAGRERLPEQGRHDPRGEPDARPERLQPREDSERGEGAETETPPKRIQPLQEPSESRESPESTETERDADREDEETDLPRYGGPFDSNWGRQQPSERERTQREYERRLDREWDRQRQFQIDKSGNRYRRR